MDYHKIFTWLTSPTNAGAWILQVFVVVFTVMLVNFMLTRLLARLYARLTKTHVHWDDALVEALRRPLRVLVWIVGIAFAAQIVQRSTNAAIFEAVGPLRDVGVIAMIAWFLVRLVNGMQHNYIRSRRAHDASFDQTTVDALAKLLRVSVIITAALVGLQTLGFSISGVLAFGGIGGIAVGFAAKDLLANFFGGLIIYLDRPFVVGDWIRSPDRDIEGTVEEIGWRLTCIRTFDKRPVYVPNSVFSTIAVQNPSRMTHRRIYETVGIRYDDFEKIGPITHDVKAMLIAHPGIDESQTLMVNFTSFASSSIDFFVYCFTRTTVWTEYHEIKQDVLLRIGEIIAGHGAEIAFPTSTVHVPDRLTIEAQGLVPALAGRR